MNLLFLKMFFFIGLVKNLILLKMAKIAKIRPKIALKIAISPTLYSILAGLAQSDF